MKTNLLTILVLLIAMGVYAQKGVVNNGAKITISNGAILDIKGVEGSYTNKSFNVSTHGKIDLDGKIKLQGNWINNASSGNVLINRDTDGEVLFNGMGLQWVGGSASTYFEKLTLNNSIGLNLGLLTQIEGNLTLTSGLFNIGTNNLYLSSATSVLGSPSASAMIVANSTGYIRKYFTGTGNFTFPVGDTLSVDEYSPFTLTFNSGTFGAGAYVELNVSNEKHPQNSSTTHYIKRYWKTNSYNVSAINADIIANYNIADINAGAAESTIYAAKYDTPYWNILNAANTTAHSLSGNITSFSDFTGAESSAILASIIIADDGIIEGSESGELITVTLTNDDFVPNLNASNWTLSNLPSGISKGTLTRTGNKTATIALLGNRDTDFDTDITNISLSVAAAELVNKSVGSVDASTGVTIIASNDVESITMADDGLITEGSEGGEVITVTAVGGTFANPIIGANWTLTNLPTGVTKGNVTRISNSTVKITLLGDRTVDYSDDITNVTLSVTASEMDEYAGGDLTVSMGVTFTAVDESLDIVMGGTFTEGNESSGIITVTINSYLTHAFNSSINQGSWILSNLPVGVTKGTVTYNSDTEVVISLIGTRTKDYDVTILNVALQIGASEIIGFGSTATLSSGLTFTAVNDSESIAIADDGLLNEGSEDAEVITVTLTGGTYADPIHEANWTVQNLPEGVDIGSIVRSSATEVILTLSNNRVVDYDADITNLTIIVSEHEIDDHTGSSIFANTGVVFKASISEPDESIVLANDGDGIAEGAENGEIITITLSGGTFVSPLNPSNWNISNQPAGVILGSINRISETEVAITLSGNANVDYDTDILDFTVTINEAEVDDHTGSSISANSNVTFTATDEPVLVTLADKGIIEGAENGELITVSIVEDIFVASINEANWSITNLPGGVTKGAVTRVSDDTVTITLNGNRNVDYDSDITNVTVQFDGAELIQHNTSPLSQNSGLLFDAVNDAESFSMASDGEILEGAESGEIITVMLSGGTFVDPINTANWTLTNLPNGVTKGLVTRLNETAATIVLSGNRTTDYDVDISDATLSIADAEIDDYTGIDLMNNSGITFTATVEAIDLAISDDGIFEGSESGEIISVSITGDTFKDPLSPSNWIFSGLPDGVSIGSILRTSSTSASIILSGNRTKDYDISITDAELTIKGAEFVAQSIDISQNSGITFIANDDNESITMTYDGVITERSESGEKITVTILNGTFAPILFSGNWAISNQPSGVVLGSLLRIDSVTAELTLAGTSGIDYDVDINNFTISIGDLEVDDYAGSNLEVSSGVVFTALNESLAISHVGLLESNLHGAEINLVLTDDSFFDAELNNASFTLNNAPSGLSIETLTYSDETHASLFLKFDNTDFDTDFTSFSITISSTEVSGGLDITSNMLSITANNDAEVLSMNSDGLIEEGSENNELITVTISGGSFAASINPSNWTVSNLPIGVSKGAVSRINYNTVEIQLLGNSTEDYDTDITNFEIQIAESEIDDYTGADLIINSGVTFTAIVELEIKSLAISSSQLIESTINGAIIMAKLTNDYLIDAIVDLNNISLLNAAPGMTVSGFNYVDSATFNIELAFDGTDFDLDITNFQIILMGGELNGAEDIVSNELSITAILEPEPILISHSGLIENNLDGAVVDVKLFATTFSGVSTLSLIALNNVPVGLSVSNFILLSDTTAQVVLAYSGEDFDTDFNGFSITFDGTLLTTNITETSNMLTIKALIEPLVTLVYSGEIFEGSEDGKVIEISLLSGTYVQDVAIESISFINFPDGVTFGNLIRISDTQLSVDLIGNRTVDYDFDYLASCTIESSAFNDYIGVSAVSQNPIVFTSFVESLTISGAELNKGNINGAEILLELSEDKFIDGIIELSNITLYNAPMGMSVNTVTFLNETQATLSFAYDGTDFASDITDFYIGLSGTECFGIDDLVSNELPIYRGVGIFDINNWGIRIYSSSENVFVTIDELDKAWESAKITIYNVKGQKVHDAVLLREKVNIVKINVKTGNYIVKVTIDGTEFVNRVFIAPK